MIAGQLTGRCSVAARSSQKPAARTAAPQAALNAVSRRTNGVSERVAQANSAARASSRRSVVVKAGMGPNQPHRLGLFLVALTGEHVTP
jgi:hypothetical protein